MVWCEGGSGREGRKEGGRERFIGVRERKGMREVVEL